MKKMVAILVCLLLVVSVLAASAIVFAGKPDKPDKPGGKPPKEEEKLAEGEETRITYEIYDQTQAAIFGDKIIWIDGERGHFQSDPSQIWLYNIGTEYKRQVTSFESKKCCPAIYDNKIVWEDKRSEEWIWDLYMYDLNEEIEYPITSTGHAFSPDIYENKIVYRDRIEDDYVILLHDLGQDGIPHTEDEGEGEYQITTEEDCSPRDPKIFGNKIVYSIEADGDPTSLDSGDIVIYDIPTGIRTVLEKRGGDGGPAIYGDIVVWSHNKRTGGNFNSGNVDIYMYNIATGVETHLTDNKATQTRPDIYENIVVWMDYRNDNFDIYMYDLGPDGEYGTGDDGEGEYRVTTNDGSQKYPRVFGNNIVYEDYRWEIPPPYNYDIYLFTLAQ